MLFSMTGYGEASYQSDLLNLSIELRSVNNRYLKVTLRATEPYNLLEAEFEKVIRRVIKGGTHSGPPAPLLPQFGGSCKTSRSTPSPSRVISRNCGRCVPN